MSEAVKRFQKVVHGWIKLFMAVLLSNGFHEKVVMCY